MKNVISGKEECSPSNSFTLKQLFEEMWQGKWIIIFSCTVLSLLSVIFALNQKDVYKAEVILAPVSQNNATGIGGMLTSQLGGLASLANINLGNDTGVNKIQLAMQIVGSRKFISSFVEKYKILPDLMASDGWNRNTNKVIYNSELYDETNSKWVRKIAPPFKPMPSYQEAHTAFLRVFNITQNKETGLISLSVMHHSPFVAKYWVDNIVLEINEELRQSDILQAEESIAFLKNELKETNVSDIKSALHSLIEEQTKTIMFANVREEYVFKTIDPALVPEVKDGPRRALICILGFIAGFLLGVLIVVTKFFNTVKNEG